MLLEAEGLLGRYLKSPGLSIPENIHRYIHIHFGRFRIIFLGITTGVIFSLPCGCLDIFGLKCNSRTLNDLLEQSDEAGCTVFANGEAEL